MDTDQDLLKSAFEFLGDGAKAVDNLSTIAFKLKGFFSAPQSSGDPELKALVVELMSQVQDAKIANFALKQELLEIREAAVKAQKQKKEFNRYELWQSPAGAVVYRLKQSDNTGEPLHYLCSGCKENAVKSILQGHDHLKECPICKTGYRFLNRNIRV